MTLTCREVDTQKRNGNNLLFTHYDMMNRMIKRNSNCRGIRDNDQSCDVALFHRSDIFTAWGHSGKIGIQCSIISVVPG